MLSTPLWYPYLFLETSLFECFFLTSHQNIGPVILKYTVGQLNWSISELYLVLKTNPTSRMLDVVSARVASKN